MTFNSNVAPKVRRRPAGAPWFCRCIAPSLLVSADTDVEAELAAAFALPVERPVEPSPTLGVRLRAVARPGYLARCPDCGEKRPHTPS